VSVLPHAPGRETRFAQKNLNPSIKPIRECQVFFKAILMNSQKIGNSPFLSFRRMPESSDINKFWMPDQVRHDDFGTFYETVNS